MGIAEHCWASLGVTEHLRAALNITGHLWASLDITGLCVIGLHGDKLGEKERDCPP